MNRVEAKQKLIKNRLESEFKTVSDRLELIRTKIHISDGDYIRA